MVRPRLDLSHAPAQGAPAGKCIPDAYLERHRVVGHFLEETAILAEKFTLVTGITACEVRKLVIQNFLHHSRINIVLIQWQSSRPAVGHDGFEMMKVGLKIGVA